VAKIKKPIVLDADALKQVEMSLIKNRDDIILTPHIFEFKSFFNVNNDLKLDIDSYDFKKVDENITEFQQITRQIKGTVLIKGQYDLILSGTRFRINKSGNSGMTVGGTGDALSGICASLLTQELDPFDCACLGVFINGIAGEKAFDVKGNGFSATDLVSHIGSVIKDGLH
ncbi:NAD(P)H-hydrate dehydratase, partial [uncultured Methanobrevibacter sp.]